MSEIFYTERTDIRQNFPAPADGEVVFEDPPLFIWVPAEDVQYYIFKLYNEKKEITDSIKTTCNYLRYPKKLDKTNFFWDVETDIGEKRGIYSFTVAEEALDFERVSARELFDAVPDVHPRHLFFGDEIQNIIKQRKKELEVLKRNVAAAMRRGCPPMPEYHRNADALPYREYFGMYRDYCDTDMIACALMYALTGDETAGRHAKDILLTICDINPCGAFSVFPEYGDEVGLSNARCLPSAFDMLYDLLDKEQRICISRTIAAYAAQCMESIERIDYPRNPSQSHIGRHAGYLGEAALILKGTGGVKDDVLISWLDTALDIYCGIFPFYGGNDGSWAEGPFYSTSYTKWYLPFFGAVERYTGKSLMNRPFYHRYTDFLMHFCDPAYELHPFGDGYWCDPGSEEWPGFFAQDPYRVYAEKFGPAEALKRQAQIPEPDMYRLHLLDIFMPVKKAQRTLAAAPRDVEVFRDGGFAVMHTEFGAENDICVMMRASRFTADSHRYADQGSFCLFAGGTALVTPSGYMGRQFGSAHHFKWTRSSKAHNTLLFNGKGQPDMIDGIAINAPEMNAGFVRVDEKNKVCVMDLGEAYGGGVRWQREITLCADGIKVCDFAETEEETEILYPLHFISQPEADGNDIFLIRKGIRLDIHPMSGGLVLDNITEHYDTGLNEDEPEKYAVTMPKQYHAYYKTEKSRIHKIEVMYKVKI